MIQESINISDKLVAIALLFTISLTFRIFLVSIGQRWVSTFAHTATMILLPIITYVITSVISGNIALSLGMVGALSIVRFRNPVKSPLELAVYFSLITLGIAASVTLNWVVIFSVAIISSLTLLFIIHKFSERFFKRPLFTYSFTEGNQLSTLEISSDSEICTLFDREYLISERKWNNQYHYTYASNRFEDLEKILENLKQNNSIEWSLTR